MKDFLEEIRERINNKDEVVFMIKGEERCGMSCIAMNIANHIIWREFENE